MERRAGRSLRGNRVPERAIRNLMAGGGVARGKVIGRTDAIGGTVTERPLRAKDVLATAYHLLSIDHHTALTDRRHSSLYGDVIREALA